MKKSKRKISILIIGIILILCIFLFQNKSNSNNYFEDELIFFKLFSKGEGNNILKSKNDINSNKVYTFQVSYKNTDFKNIYLADTIKKETLIREKIAPRNRRLI